MGFTFTITRKQRTPKAEVGLPKKMLGVFLFTTFWCGITSVFIVISVGAILKHMDAKKRFLSTAGVVVSSEIRTHSGEDTTYSPHIVYRYSVDGQEYTSDRYMYGEGSTSDHNGVAEIVAKYPARASIMVYYDPLKPSESLLHLDVPGLHYFLLLFLRPFILIGLAGIGYFFVLPFQHGRMKRFLESGPKTGPPWEIPTWGVLQADGGGWSIQPRTSRATSALTALVMGYGIACFLAMFIVIFSGGSAHPAPRQVALGFEAALFVGVMSAVTTLIRGENKARLFIDPRIGELSLSSSLRQVRVSLHDAAGWLVRPMPNLQRVKQESDLPYMPLLALKIQGGEEVPVHAFKPTPEGVDIARHAGGLIAGLTNLPFEETGYAPEAKPTAVNLSDLVAAAREERGRTREFADLM